MPVMKTQQPTLPLWGYRMFVEKSRPAPSGWLLFRFSAKQKETKGTSAMISLARSDDICGLGIFSFDHRMSGQCDRQENAVPNKK